MVHMFIALEAGGYGIEGIKENVSHPVAQTRKQGNFFCDSGRPYLSCRDLNCSSPNLYLI